MSSHLIAAEVDLVAEPSLTDSEVAAVVVLVGEHLRDQKVEAAVATRRRNRSEVVLAVEVAVDGFDDEVAALDEGTALVQAALGAAGVAAESWVQPARTRFVARRLDHCP